MRNASFPYNGRKFSIPGHVDFTAFDSIRPTRHHLVEAAAQDFIAATPGLLRSSDLEDKGMPKILWGMVDLQNVFLLSPDALGLPPYESLSVPGALASAERTVRAMYEYAPYIWGMFVTEDTHPPFTVHSRFWYIVAATGKPPAPFTPISVDDLRSGRVVPIFDFAGSGLKSPLEYAQELWATYGPGSPDPRPWNQSIMAWPTHSQEGSPEAALQTDIWQAMHYWSIVMQANPWMQQKGKLLDSENYGAFQAAVPTASPSSSFNMEFFRYIKDADWVIWGGAQARTHCSVDTFTQLVRAYESDPETSTRLNRLVVLDDCHDNIPDVTDGKGTVLAPFRQWADDAFAAMAKKGVRILKSTDPEFHQIMTGQVA